MCIVNYDYNARLFLLQLNITSLLINTNNKNVQQQQVPKGIIHYETQLDFQIIML